MKIYLYTLILVAFLTGSCKDVLETNNIYQKDLTSYYSTPTEVGEALSGVYNALYVSDVKSEEMVAANIFSDEMLAGGGDDDKVVKYMDGFTDPVEDTYRDLWKSTYNGVYRCNAIIEKVTDADYSQYYSTTEEATTFKNQTLGEAYFMRAFLLFRAAKFFGGLPLIIKTDTPRDIARATVSETYSQIIADLKMSIESFPSKAAADYSLAEFGHANKWIAEGYMGRVFLYYTGYMTNIEKQATTEVIIPDGTVTKANVISWLEDCRDHSGYKMLPDFRNLWPYSYVNESAAKYTQNGTTPLLPWAATQGLKWAGQDGIHSAVGTGNTEVMFSLRFSFGDWGKSTSQYTNRLCLYDGIRDNSLKPFFTGWGWGSVHTLFFDQWNDLDTRKLGSVLQMGKTDQGTGNFLYKSGDQYTGLVNKKYQSLVHNGPEGDKGMFCYIYGTYSPDMQLWHAQDFIYMRFSDILLMHSELSETADGMNEIRERAGLGTVAYSLAALKEERKHEFAFEGLRWFDLVRWGDVEGTNNYYGSAVDVVNSGVEGSYSITYRPETKGLVPLPESEIRLSNGVYQQNPGWN